jgi:hypothetical protein
VDGGFRLERQYRLDDLFGDLVSGEEGDEIDLEGLSFDGTRLWLCGSHCHVRRKPKKQKRRRRSSRQFFGSIALAADGALGDEPAPIALPATGPNSLRGTMRDDPYLASFLKLPSKQGGLDIEGVLVRDRRAWFGLRGPLIDGMAIVMEMALSEDLGMGAAVVQRHSIQLGGLGVRGLASWGGAVLIIAGPLTNAQAPFRLFLWRPEHTQHIQEPHFLFEWPEAGEKPEGICPLSRDDGKKGLLVVFDSPDEARIIGATYRAEWRAVAEA